MIARILRQWRRLLLCVVLLLLIFLVGQATGLVEIRSHATDVVAVLYGIFMLVLVVGVPLLLLTLLAPSQLITMEITLLSLLVTAALFPLFHPIVAALERGKLVYVLLWAMSYYVVCNLIYGNWLIGFFRRDVPKRTITFTVDKNPDDVWRALFPSVANADSYFWPQTQFLPAPDESKAQFLMIAPRKSGIETVPALVFIEKEEPFSRFRYTALAVHRDNQSGYHGARIELMILEQNGKCAVELTETFLNAPMRERLFWFLTDNLRDTAACMRCRILGKPDWSILGTQLVRH